MNVEYPDIIMSPDPTAKTWTVKQIENVLMKRSKAVYHDDTNNNNNNNNNNNDAPYTQQTLMMRTSRLNCARIFTYATIRTTAMWTRWQWQ
eukprot:scaffold16199_cov36-Cyclotella_meneghiniana.AAC.3